MGKLIIFSWYYLHIWAGENEERRHIHAFRINSRNAYGAKFWIEPDIELFEKGEFSDVELNKIEKDIKENIAIINKQLHIAFAGRKVKAIVIKDKKGI
jgi:hypothetical protein